MNIHGKRSRMPARLSSDRRKLTKNPQNRPRRRTLLQDARRSLRGEMAFSAEQLTRLEKPMAAMAAVMGQAAELHGRSAPCGTAAALYPAVAGVAVHPRTDSCAIGAAETRDGSGRRRTALYDGLGADFAYCTLKVAVSSGAQALFNWKHLMHD
jgi:hypothetical protein